MKKRWLALIVILMMSARLIAKDDSVIDDFKREGKAESRVKKDALEGKLAPKLQVSEWLNTKDGKALKLADLKGKVVLLDYWGVW